MAEVESGSKVNISIRAQDDAVVIVINDITPLVVTPVQARNFADGLMVAAALVERRVRPPEVAGKCAVCQAPTTFRVCGRCVGENGGRIAVTGEFLPRAQAEPKRGRRKK